MTCKLELINKEPFYIPGSYIEGKLNCSFRIKREVELIEVRFFGRESANYKVTHEVLFHSDRSICYTHTVFLRSATVEKGKHAFDFKIKIPHHIPSTYVSEYGSIRYHLEGLLVATSTKVDSSQLSIQIFSPIDIKSFSSELHRPAKITERRDVLGICGGSGHISAIIQVDKKVFLCGESINMNAIINNSSGVRVRSIRASLTKSASCKLADGEYDVSKERMISTKKFKAHVGKGEEKTIPVSLKIPEDLELPNLKYSELFKMKYWIHVCVIYQSFWHRPFDICFKVYLAHLPVNF